MLFQKEFPRRKNRLLLRLSIAQTACTRILESKRFFCIIRGALLLFNAIQSLGKDEVEDVYTGIPMEQLALLSQLKCPRPDIADARSMPETLLYYLVSRLERSDVNVLNHAIGGDDARDVARVRRSSAFQLFCSKSSTSGRTKNGVPIPTVLERQTTDPMAHATESSRERAVTFDLDDFSPTSPLSPISPTISSPMISMPSAPKNRLNDSENWRTMLESGTSFRQLGVVRSNTPANVQEKADRDDDEGRVAVVSHGTTTHLATVASLKIRMSRLHATTKDRVEKQIAKLQRLAKKKRWDLLRDFPEVKRGSRGDEYEWGVCREGFWDAVMRLKRELLDELILFKSEVIRLESEDPNAVSKFMHTYAQATRALTEIERVEKEIKSAHSFLCRQLLYDPKNPKHYWRNGVDQRRIRHEDAQRALKRPASFEDTFCVILDFLQAYDVARTKFVKRETKRAIHERLAREKLERRSKRRRKKKEKKHSHGSPSSSSSSRSVSPKRGAIA